MQIPNELRTTVGRSARSLHCDLVQGVFMYENTESGGWHLMLRDGIDWYCVNRSYGAQQIAGLMVLLRRLGIVYTT